MGSHRKLVESLQAEHGDNLILVGYRGSLAMKIDSDDVDILVVLREAEHVVIQDDQQLYDVETFLRKYSTGALEVAEALYNKLYVNKKDKDVINSLTSGEHGEAFNQMVLCDCYLAIKNQLKLSTKFVDNENKFIAKAQLYHDIVEGNYSAASVWGQKEQHKVVKDYVNNRYNDSLDIDTTRNNLLEYRNDKTRRAIIMEKKNKAHVVLRNYANQLVNYLALKGEASY